jgi:outer membrane protein assembly factor BamB
LWQHVLVYPDEQQNAVILGADGSYIYVASTQTHPAPGSKGSTIQLFAVNRATGSIDWRVFGPTEPYNDPHDNGQLLLKEGQAIWQVAGTIYAIDPIVGQIEWRRQITEDEPSILVQEDVMTEVAGTLLVMRRHSIHGLDPTTGNKLWTLPGKGVNTAQSVAGVSVVGQTILVYGNGQIEAFDAIDRHSLWRQSELNTIEHVSVSDDGKTAYLVEKSNVAGSSPLLVYLDVQTGTTQWTFEPARQTTFLYASSDKFFSRNGILFVTVCFPSGHQSCTRERLYALAAATGKTMWTFTGRRIANLHLSQDGKTLLFSVTSNAWIDLLAYLPGG